MRPAADEPAAEEPAAEPGFDEPGFDDPAQELAFWRELATSRGEVIRALHEFNYWHASTIARGEVIAGLEEALDQWRERCLGAEAQVADLQAALPVAERVLALARGGARASLRVFSTRRLALAASRPGRTGRRSI